MLQLGSQLKLLKILINKFKTSSTRQVNKLKCSFWLGLFTVLPCKGLNKNVLGSPIITHSPYPERREEEIEQNKHNEIRM